MQITLKPQNIGSASPKLIRNAFFTLALATSVALGGKALVQNANAKADSAFFGKHKTEQVIQKKDLSTADIIRFSVLSAAFLVGGALIIRNLRKFNSEREKEAQHAGSSSASYRVPIPSYASREAMTGGISPSDYGLCSYEQILHAGFPSIALERKLRHDYPTLLK